MALWVAGTKVVQNILVPTRAAGYDSSNVWTYADAALATGGSASDLQKISVLAGQNIDLILSLNFGYWTGVDFTITEETGPGSVSGVVTDAASDLPIDGVAVALTGPNTYNTTTNSVGEYSLPSVDAGTYTATFTKTGYGTETLTVSVAAAEDKTLDASMIPDGVQVWDLAKDWSDLSNPNGVWEYGVLEPQSLWFYLFDNPALASGGDFGGDQPIWNYWDWAWYNMIFKSNGTLMYDIPQGRIGGYENFGFRWTAPEDVTVNIIGGAWMVRGGPGKSMSLFINDAPCITGKGIPDPSSGVNSGNIYTFAQAVIEQGQDMSVLQQIPMLAGQTISVSLSGGNYAGVDFKVTTGPPPPVVPSSISGVVRDGASQPVAGATVLLSGSTIQETTTAGDGTYSFTNVTMDLYTLGAAKVGYTGTSQPLFAQPGQHYTRDMTITEHVGLDIAREAMASSNAGGYFNRVNDGDVATQWQSETGGVSEGDYLQLTWSVPVDISAVLVDSVGPIQSYTIQSSADGSTWADITTVTSAATGQWHEVQYTSLPATVTTRYLRILANVSNSSAAVWSLECFKPTANVSGYVKNAFSMGVADAAVYVYELISGVRGSSRYMGKAITDATGYYSMEVPEGPVMLTAAPIDGMSVDSAPIDVVAGSPIVMPDTIVTQAGSSEVFFDDFADGMPGLRWDYVRGLWDVDAEGRFYDMVPDTSGSIQFAAVSGLNLIDSTVECDMWGHDVQLIARYKDFDNMMFLTYTGGHFYWHQVHDGQWPYCPLVPVSIDESGGYKMRSVVVGNQAQGWIDDGYNVYWTAPYTLDYDLWPGKVGVGAYLPVGASGFFDNFRVYQGAGSYELSTVGEAKAAAPGWQGKVQGVITAVLTDFDTTYLEAKDRSCGIKITPLPSPAPAVGSEVEAVVVKLSDGSFSTVSMTVLATGQDVKPLGVNNRDSGGYTGLDNTNLLVTTWGEVISDPVVNLDGSTRFHITDGTASDADPQVIVYSPTPMTVFQDAFDSALDPLWVAGGSGSLDVTGGKLIATGQVWPHVDIPVPNGTVTVQFQAGEYCGIRFRCVPGMASPMAFLIYNGPAGTWYGDEYVSGVKNYLPTPTGLTGTVTMTVMYDGLNVVASISDGVTTYNGSYVLQASTGTLGTYCGIYREGGAQTTIDNFAITAPGRSVSAKAVEVVIPASAGSVTVNPGDYISVTGIAGESSLLRGVIVRQLSDIVPQ
jgi:hypothetical protein